MAGIVIAHTVVSPIPLLPVFVGLVVAALLLWRWPLAQSVAVCLCFVALGALLMERQEKSLQVLWSEGETSFGAVVLSEPVEKPKTMAVDLLLTGNGQKLKAYIHKDERSRGLHVGDGVMIASSREQIANSRTIYVSSWNWQKANVSLQDLPRIERSRIFFLKQRNRLLQRFKAQGLEGDVYAVVAAMALGDKTALTRELKDVYAETGASHILALSGLHLGIIYVLLSLLIMRRRWRLFAQVLTVLSIWAFVFLVGLSTSVVRSAVMLTVYALLSLGHRQKMSVNTLAFTAIVMLCCNPATLFDVGFQLSFMAVFSILLFLPLLTPRLSPLTPRPILRWLWGIAAVSLAAQIGVAPLTAYYFGRFSTWFLLTNFVVIPAATLILYLSLAVLVVPALTFLLVYVVSTLNAVLTRIATMPLASISGLHPTVLQVVLVYVAIGASYLIAQKLFFRR